jgi:hypothetical protein
VFSPGGVHDRRVGDDGGSQRFGPGPNGPLSLVAVVEDVLDEADDDDGDD